MISFMAYALAISGLLGLAALLAERIVAELAWARRGVWLVSLAGSLLLPVYSVWLSEAATGESGIGTPFAFELLPGVVPVELAGVVTAAISESWLSLPDWQSFDFPLIVFWILTSSLALAFGAFAAGDLHRSIRSAETVTLGGQQVVLSDRLGPAVIGFLRPRIILPRWITRADASLRALVLHHEREHIAAHDQLTLLGALLVVASMPWNVALWWQLRRLRAAIEVDCDARVIRAGADKVAYSKALLFVRQRNISVPLGAVALTEPVSQLEQRIRIMLNNARKLSISRVGMRSGLVAALLVVAFAIEAPLAQQAGSEPTAEGPAVIPTIRVSVFDQLNEAQICMDSRDFGCARAWLDSVSQMDLNGYETAQYWNFMAFIAFEEGDSESATGAYENVLAQQNIPQGLREAALRNVSTLYANSGRHAQAYERLNELLELRGMEQFRGLGGAGVTDGEYLPIVKVAPIYPPRAASRRLEGYVVVEYTVNAGGSTEDVRVVESSSTLFDRPAIESAQKYKYKPRVIDGVPIAVPGVRSRIVFELESDDEPEA